MSSIKKVGVIGAGQMGAGIAQVFGASGFQTLLWDANSEALQRGFSTIKSSLSRMEEKEKISKEDVEKTLGNIGSADGLGSFADCDLVVEAIIEKLEIKNSIFEELNGIVKDSAILASNTSSISITEMAKASGRPEQFIGMHFMNPVPIMKLVEIIRGLQTSDKTYNSINQTVAALDKTAVLGIDSPGFVVNRILCPMINEAIFLLQEGVSAEDIDNAMVLGTNQPMGPLTLADFVGLDTLLYILRILHRELGEDKYRPCPLLTKYVEAGWYGRKSGRGFYNYDKK